MRADNLALKVEMLVAWAQALLAKNARGGKSFLGLLDRMVSLERDLQM